jgi:uncharacterized protein
MPYCLERVLSRLIHFTEMKALHIISFILVVVGGLNWGLIGLGELVSSEGWNVVNMIFGTMPTVEAIVYLLVGLSAVALLVSHKNDCRACSPSGMM